MGGNSTARRLRLFVEELATVVGKLRDGMDAERQQYAARVYYRVDDAAGEVEVLVVWNATAGQAPDV